MADGVERLFIALWPGAEARAALDRFRQAWQWNARANPVTPESLHVTLNFLGDVDRERAQALEGMLPHRFQSFDLHFEAGTIWEHGIAVLEPVAVPPALIDLHNATSRVVQQLGLPPDQYPVYRPHVTMARRAENTTPPAGVPPVVWHVDTYALIASRPEGYVVVKSWTTL